MDVGQFPKRQDRRSRGGSFLFSAFKSLEMREVVHPRDLCHEPEEVCLVLILTSLKVANQRADDVSFEIAPVYEAQQGRIAECACQKASEVALVPIEVGQRLL